MAASDTDHDERHGRRQLALYVEDAIILLCIVALFPFGVFWRFHWWGQVGLGVIFVVMAVVFFFRFRRVHRAFTGRDE